MATQICNVLVINLASFSSATSVVNRTYTATRPLRLFDLKVLSFGETGAATFQIANAGNTCISMGPTIASNDVARLGQVPGDTVDDAFMLVATGAAILFSNTSGVLSSASLYCFPL